MKMGTSCARTEASDFIRRFDHELLGLLQGFYVNTIAVLVSILIPVFYTSHTDRAATYGSWPLRIGVLKEALAEEEPADRWNMQLRAWGFKGRHGKPKSNPNDLVPQSPILP